MASPQAQSDSHQKQLFPTWPQVPVRERSSRPAVSFAVILSSSNRWIKTLTGRLARQIKRIMLPSSQFRPPLRPRRRYTAAPLELLDQDQKAHSLIRFSVSGPILSCLATFAHPGGPAADVSMTSLLTIAGGLRSTSWWGSLMYSSHCHTHTNSIAGLDLICNLWFVEGTKIKCSYFTQRVLYFSFLFYFS